MEKDNEDLYAIYYPSVGKRIVSKNTMIAYLKQYITKIEEGGMVMVGEGFAFRNIQVIDDNKPYVPHQNDEDFLKSIY